MKAMLGALALVVAAGLVPLGDDDVAGRPGPTADGLAGAWAGTLSHDGETVDFALEIEPAEEGQVVLRATIPVIHMAHGPLGRVPFVADGNEVRLGPFAFNWDAASGTLQGTLPEEVVPVYAMPLTLRRVAAIDAPARPEPSAPLVAPVWTFDAGAPLWAGPSFAGGAVFVGGDDGRVVALDAGTGRERWSFRAGGPVRTRPTVAGGNVYLQADDGVLYALGATDGAERWHVRVVAGPVERLPFDNPKSRYDRFGSDVTVVGDRLYLGTHDGHLLALRAAGGERIWDFAAADSVLAAPAVDAGRVYFGSFDGHVYALDAASGELRWKRDTRGAVVSTPAVAGGRVVVGNRAYDLLALDARTGDVAWKRYVWFSWVESSATVRDGVAYVGSSDAASVFAFDVASGRRLWAADVYGWAWGQPAVTTARVFTGTASMRGYNAGHRGGVVALDRATGATVWRYAVAVPETGSSGFPGSPATGDGRVFLGGLDGRVYAFAE